MSRTLSHIEQSKYVKYHTQELQFKTENMFYKEKCFVAGYWGGRETIYKEKEILASEVYLVIAMEVQLVLHK